VKGPSGAFRIPAGRAAHVPVGRDVRGPWLWATGQTRPSLGLGNRLGRPLPPSPLDPAPLPPYTPPVRGIRAIRARFPLASAPFGRQKTTGKTTRKQA